MGSGVGWGVSKTDSHVWPILAFAQGPEGVTNETSLTFRACLKRIKVGHRIQIAIDPLKTVLFLNQDLQKLCHYLMTVIY